MNVQIYAFFPVVCICSPFFEKHCPAFYFFNIWNIQYPHADVFSRQTWTTGTIPVGNAFPNCVVPVVVKTGRMGMRLAVNAPKGQEEPSPGQSETKWSDTLGKMHPDGPRPTGARGNIRNAFPYEPFQRSLLPLSGRRVCGCPIPRVPLVTLALPWARFLLPLWGVPFQLLLR